MRIVLIVSWCNLCFVMFGLFYVHILVLQIVCEYKLGRIIFSQRACQISKHFVARGIRIVKSQFGNGQVFLARKQVYKHIDSLLYLRQGCVIARSWHPWEGDQYGSTF